MKKFKRIFYLIYLLFFAFGGFIAVYYEDIVLRWDWDHINTWAGLLRFVLKFGAFGLILFFTEIVVENIHIFSLRRKIKGLEKDVADLKGKLYDQGQEMEAANAASETNGEEETEEEEQ